MVHSAQVHDFHPPVAPSGLYWVAPIPEGGLTFHEKEKTATLHIKNLEVIDQPQWPDFKAAATPARMTIKIVWKATSEKILYDDPSRQFRVEGFRATAQMEASVEVPSIGFSWKSDPLEKSKAAFAIIGDEVNGKYYTS